MTGADGLMARALAEHAAGRTEAALAAVAAALAAAPGRADAHHLRGRIERARGRLDAAEAAFADARDRAPADPQVLFDLARTAVARGSLARAEDAFAALRALAPDAPLVLAHLAMLRTAQRRWPEARALLERALERDPDLDDARSSLGGVLIEMGLPAEAIRVLSPLVARRPGEVDLSVALAGAHRAIGDLDAARRLLEAALDRAADRRDVLLGLGHVAREAGDDPTALAWFDRAVAAAPDHPDGHRQRALVLARQGRHADAAAAFARVAALRPEAGLARTELGHALDRLGRHAEALAMHRQAVRLDPGSAIAWCNLGAALGEDDPDAAARCYRTAAAVDPSSAEAWNNLAAARRDAGALEEAIALFDRALALQPDFALARWNRALARLRAGDFRGGWDDLEARWSVATFTTPRPRHDRTAWAGEPIAGRTILVQAEQGLGDTIQFARFLPRLAALGARVVLECSPVLARLLAGSADVVVSRGDALPPFDTWLPMMSLGRALAVTRDDLPGPIPYLAAAAPWSLARPGRRAVGLVWAGNPRHSNDRNRSIPLDRLAPLLERGDVDWFSLQVGEARSEIGVEARILDLAPRLADMADTAAAVAGLDLVISVDTAVAHLAGALGRPVWTLLPLPSDWRWHPEGDASPWYPTMRLFRQTVRGDWSGPLAAVAAALSEP